MNYKRAIIWFITHQIIFWSLYPYDFKLRLQVAFFASWLLSHIFNNVLELEKKPI